MADNSVNLESAVSSYKLLKAQWAKNVLNISAGPNLASRYLFKSYSNPCATDTRLQLPIKVKVHSGILAIGVLSEDFQKWVHRFIFETGAREETLQIDTGTNHRIQIVLFARGDAALDAEIDWGENLESVPERERKDDDEQFEVPGLEGTAPAQGEKSDGHPEQHIAAPHSAKPKKVKFYCQKPWTDVNNFTVDGRMDVCCITTGSSQAHYAIGNIQEQNFQEIWNGERMRDFRRTVNSDKPLPPCQRCPMAYGYQGPFFDRKLAETGLRQRFVANLIDRHILRRIAGRIVYALCTPLVPLLFRGFKR